MVQPDGQQGSVRGMTFLLVDGDKGVEQTQKWEWRRYFHVGHMDGTPTEGDGEVYSRTLMFATFPQDIRGLGTFTIRYMDPNRVDDMWAYTKQTRRVRRVSGGGWMDPIGGTDMLQDDQDIWDAPPSWYKQVRLIEKRWVLAVAHGQRLSAHRDGGPPDLLCVMLDPAVLRKDLRQLALGRGRSDLMSGNGRQPTMDRIAMAMA